MIEVASAVLLFVTFMAFAAKRVMTYMHIYQQEEYDSGRFFKWLFKHWAIDKRVSLAVIVAAGISLVPDAPVILMNFIIFAAMAYMTYKEPDPRKDSKKKLAMTARAQRIMYPALAISILFGVWVFVAPYQYGLWLISIHVIPFSIMLVNMLLFPVEDLIQKRYWREAHAKLMDIRPTIIGITGSYGKTSVKHILGHILKLNAPTLVTPGSVNTAMGISRIIRENLTEDHKFFIVEMGAYGPHSIEKLCKLTPPDMGIITAVGHAHYERFKTLEAVAETKYELAEAVLAHEDGQVIVHERTLRFDYAREMKEEHLHSFIVCGDAPPDPNSKAEQPGAQEQSFMEDGDLEIQDVRQHPRGLEIRLRWKNVIHIVNAPIFGVHHGHNLAMAFVAALELGVNVRDIQTALDLLPQIEHRLEVKEQNDGTTIIDDAYNSNPMGFQSALNLLQILGNSGRKILITPGMVEMGKAHTEAHQKIGEYAGHICDIAIVVNGKRIPSFIKGFKKTGGGKEVHEVPTFSDAQKWVAKNKKDGDYILVENDLPDLYERIPRI